MCSKTFHSVVRSLPHSNISRGLAPNIFCILSNALCNGLPANMPYWPIKGRIDQRIDELTNETLLINGPGD
jgi:hypothetical protein